MKLRRTRVLFRPAKRRLFDGNRTDDLSDWLFPEPDFYESFSKWLHELASYTEDGNLAWVVFPPEGFRL